MKILIFFWHLKLKQTRKCYEYSMFNRIFFKKVDKAADVIQVEMEANTEDWGTCI